uniref:Uncharacterized protein n=1 Tax=Denticeps clupeoides TaxID=299321 RepID=A0AAY3ZTI5_9TELE
KVGNPYSPATSTSSSERTPRAMTGARGAVCGDSALLSGISVASYPLGHHCPKIKSIRFFLKNIAVYRDSQLLLLHPQEP